MDDPNCPNHLDHAVTAVGYGSENGKDYLIVRNSWGVSWGEQGHFRIAIDKNGPGVCGVLEDGNWPTSQ